MDYKPKFLEGWTIAEINEEIERMNHNQYYYGMAIDRPRLWDLEYTKRELLKDADR